MATRRMVCTIYKQRQVRLVYKKQKLLRRALGGELGSAIHSLPLYLIVNRNDINEGQEHWEFITGGFFFFFWEVWGRYSTE